MKLWLIAALSVAFGSCILASPLGGGSALLGAKECTWGPTHWCKNLTNAKNCNAVTHCIQTVWEKQTVPEDNDSVCQICLDMVKQARDQLESNETQDDLRAVFEGSCKLIYVKPIVKECIKVVDNFIPELIEALASQMNPQVVCSVAGLCNNAHIDQLLEENKEVRGNEGKEFTCGKCSSIASHVTSKFHGTSRDTVLENMLEMCGKMGSFSDACSSILLTYFNEIYSHLSDNLTPDSLCHMSGTCAGKYHQHPELVEIRPMSDVGFVDVKDDIPCELCEQLVGHLKDLLVANTTESEFKTVLEGLCGQTKGFKEECLSIVDQYYAEIYEFITNSLDSNAACYYIGVCPKGGLVSQTPIAPLVPVHVQAPKKLLGANEPKFTDEEIQSFQLPLERMAGRPIDKLMGAPNSQGLESGGKWCTMCEYAMHFVQEELADTKNSEELKNAVIKTCHKMPSYLRTECDNFVDLYGDAILALLISELDPSQVCPELKVCPKIESDSEIFSPSTINVQVHSESSEKGSCPLCILAVQQAKDVILNDKSEEKVRDTLKNLCSHIKNKKLNIECQDFVDTYYKELVELLVRDFTTQEICVYLKLCTGDGPKPEPKIIIKDQRDREIETNEIADFTIDGIMISSPVREVVADTPECLLCKEIVKEAEKRVVNKKSKADIKQALEHACDKVPRKAQQTCHNYVDKHGDRIAELIMEELSPKEICRDLQLCYNNFEGDLDVDDAVQVTVYTSASEEPTKPNPNCLLCEMIVTRMDKELEKPATQEEIKHFLDGVCALIPKHYKKDCDQFIDKYADVLIQTADHIPPKQVCQDMKMCTAVNTVKETQEEIVECAVCRGAVVTLDTLLKNKQFDDKLEGLFDEACREVGARYYQRCMNLVNVYGISIIEQLKQELSSDKICSNIGICYETDRSGIVDMESGEDDDSDSDEDIEEIDELEVVTKKQFLVGENECTWGPSHWCKDEETANKCKSLEFCKSKALGKWKA